ncbi:aminotransferase class I/II-fold pyridoxal phosphate-dependent enzyme [Planococcus sp. ISL-109]|uniref:DegT/DnrJ/EryC1/StrS family aminotransferase n=1 Tax=Planococcus sp. ISL-109 TaxID=2819166 RepID=UPI002035066F|nr:aminotransferase class I/II-fold pyridoxal phosphate-dependent enzyme [Planococcus sp. ISL-109]
MTGNEQKYIAQAFESNWIAPMGENINQFEAEIAAYATTGAAAALSSGTAAIHLALQLLGVGKGDRVFCSSLTFVASANPIIYAGAEPVFIDSEEETWNMSPWALQKAFAAAEQEGKLPKAVIIVHIYGQCARMDELIALCSHYGVPIIEDAAESLGSTYKGRKTGSLGTYGIFSFNGNKIITTSGGGMLVSNDRKAIGKARFLASQAKDDAPYYEHSRVGYNYRMSNVLAGIGRAQLEAIELRVTARREVYSRYFAAIGNHSAVKFQPELEGTRSNRWLSVMLLDPAKTDRSPDYIREWLESENIEARRVWKPLHLQPLFAGCKFYSHNAHGKTAVSEKLFAQGLCLPSGSDLEPIQQDRIIQLIEEILP